MSKVHCLVASDRNPHLASPCKGEEPAGVYGEMLPQKLICSSPYEGEVGWGWIKQEKSHD